MKKLRFLWPVVGLIGLVLVYRHFKPDTFFSNIGLNVPQSAIVSHRVPFFVLKAEIHEIVLQMPPKTWPPVLKQFQAQPRFRDMSPQLASSYPAFRSGHEDFFPPRPAKATAGEFLAQGRDHYFYLCRYLRDDKTGQVWLYVWSPDD